MSPPDQAGTFDLAVVGSGSAGLAAAVCGARRGLRTLLLESRSSPGGLGGHSGLTTLCGLHDENGAPLNEGFPTEFARRLAEGPALRTGRVWVLPYRPSRFRALAAELLASLPTLRCRWDTPLTQVRRERDRITGLNQDRVEAVIDASGFAEVARLAGVDCLATDERTQSPAIVAALAGITAPLDTAAAAARVMLPLARAGFPPLYFHPGLDPGLVTVKFTGRPDQLPGLLEFLRSHIDGFQHCRLLPGTGEESAGESPAGTAGLHPVPRAGRMIPGRHLLTGSEVLAGGKFPDAVARCAWPVEQWGPDGRSRVRYLAPGTHYEIPARSLQCREVANLFMAGKTISADEEAIASARVMGCCLATGAAAGNLAADWLASPRASASDPARPGGS